MRKIIFFLSITLLFTAISFQSCSSCNHKKKKDDKDSAFVRGRVISNVSCKKDYIQNYALYLPSYYSEDKKWPVVCAFDSHGKGLLPVELFKDEAEKYGYIILGSNNSKNGIPGLPHLQFMTLFIMTPTEDFLSITAEFIQRDFRVAQGLQAPWL